MIGTVIGRYRIDSKLGEGGMGVVYKATDTKLDRTVALKFLPPHVSVNEETKTRFLQEAKAAAALNHSNICTIHGVEEADDQMFIVMEFVDGGTLRRKVPFASLDDAVTAAIQIGEALQEAHAKGIVHRDIKADNIMLTSKGQAKVMDFGLAKLKGSLKLTRTSSTVGTLAYMAPEQIQGGEVDTRSDIFSFGSLLFEMLTGKTPFRGEHEAAMVYSIVNEEPQSLEALRQDLPPLLVGLIQKCLEKDPADRYQHMDDIVSELRRTQKKSTRVFRSSSYVPTQQPSVSHSTGPVSQYGFPSEPLPSPAVNPLIRYGMIGAAVVLLGVLGWYLFGRSGISVNPDMTTKVLQVPFTQYSYPSLSPDGKWIAFPAADANSKWDVYYMHVSGGEPRKITNDGTVFIQQTASISPDGSQIAYDRPNEGHTSHDLHTISALGGTSRKLAERVTIPLWKPDGERIGFIRTPTGDSHIRGESPYMEFWTVRNDGQDIRKEWEDTLFVPRGNFRFSFCWSPDGKSIAWIRSFTANSQVLIRKNLETGEEVQLTEGNENLDAMQWTMDDRIIFSSNRGGNTNLWAIKASGGEAVQVTKGGGPDLSVSVASNGNTLVYLQQQPVGFLWTAGVDGSSLRQITFDERDIWEPSYSPDMKRIAYIMSDPDPLTNKSDLYVVDADGNNRRRMTTGNAITRLPIWSPDGRRISYMTTPTQVGADTGVARIHVVEVDNPGAPKLAGKYFAIHWLDDDHVVSTDGIRSYVNKISTGVTRRFHTDSLSVWSILDGTRLAYYDRRTASRGWWTVDIDRLNLDRLMSSAEEVLMPALRGVPRKVSSSPIYLQAWATSMSRTGEVLQFAGNDQVRRMSFTSRSESILPAKFPGMINRSIDLSSDGKKIVYVTPRLSSRLVMIDNVFE